MRRGTRIASHLLAWSLAAAAGAYFAFGTWIVSGLAEGSATLVVQLGGALVGSERAAAGAVDLDTPAPAKIGMLAAAMVGLIGSGLTEGIARIGDGRTARETEHKG